MLERNGCTCGGRANGRVGGVFECSAFPGTKEELRDVIVYFREKTKHEKQSREEADGWMKRWMEKETEASRRWKTTAAGGVEAG